MLALLSGAASAQHWYIAPKASLDTFHDDNVRLSSSNPQSSAGAIARAEVALGRRTEVSEVEIGGEVSSRQYTSLPELDRTDGSLALNTAYQMERSRFGLDTRVDYDSTLTSEVATSGLVQVNKRRTRLYAAPSWSYSLGNRASFELGASYTDVTYEDVGSIPLYNYTMAGATLDTTYLWSERTQLFSRLLYDYYSAEQPGTSSETVGLLLGGAHALSERLSLRALAGPRFATNKTPNALGGTTTTNSTGALVDLSLEKQFNEGELVLSGSQALVPSSSGELVSTTSAGLALDYPIGARWSVLFDATAYRNRNPDGVEDANDRDYVSLQPRLRHELSDWWTVDLSYRLRYQKYRGAENEALSNGVFLTLGYTPGDRPLAQWSPFD